MNSAPTPRCRRSLTSRAPARAFGSVRAILLAASLATPAAAANRTALDAYVAAPDPAYAWTVVDTVKGKGYSTAILELTSQSWLTTNEVDRTLWKHWLPIVIPDDVAHDGALLFIGGGGNDKPAPKSAEKHLIQTALATRSVVAELKNVPNQPLVFVGDGQKRVEDELIAFAWDKYLRNGDDRWLPRLPMTKSAVRAMDTITAFCASPAGGGRKVDRFVIAGGSKRGWTTWTTGAVDPRVVGIVPIVIDMLNIEPSFKHHWEAYGFWAPAVGDYVNLGIMEWQGTREYHNLMKIVEPYEYRDRLTMPKFIINATGDQFFVCDSSQFYFEDLKGPKFLRYVPNADHGLKDTDAAETLASCYHAILNRTPLPEFAWKFGGRGTVRVTTRTSPTAVKLWQATNPKARDFRLETLGPVWTSTDLQPVSPGVYEARVEKPAQGWTAFLVECTFANPGAPAPFKFTTDVKVVPEQLPFRYRPPDRHPSGGGKPRAGGLRSGR